MKNFPNIDKDLIVALEKLYSQLPYDPNLSNEEFARRSAFAAGQMDVINKLYMLFDKQQKERMHG